MTITVYTFEDKEGNKFDSFHTQDYEEAKEYARTGGLKVIANEFAWADSKLVDDFTESEPCARCGSKLDDNGFCQDLTCLFSDHLQSCQVGWRGHSERAARISENKSGGCTCGGRLDE